VIALTASNTASSVIVMNRAAVNGGPFGRIALMAISFHSRTIASPVNEAGVECFERDVLVVAHAGPNAIPTIATIKKATLTADLTLIRDFISLLLHPTNSRRVFCDSWGFAGWARPPKNLASLAAGCYIMRVKSIQGIQDAINSNRRYFLRE
jgi:hypothetical protein